MGGYGSSKIRATRRRRIYQNELFTMEDNEICDFYLVDIGEKSIEKLVEAMGLENEFFVVFYEFSEDCFWDKMILKDEMTVVLVKDNNYFWAKRMSEKDPAGLYGSYF